MARPRRFRKIFHEPEISCFKPEGEGDHHESEAIEITMGEFEAIRLKITKKSNRKRQQR
jgi:predicted DNA-binding protein (UPF0251 family)